MKKQTTMIIGAFIAAVLTVAVGWYLLSPLWINVEVDEGFPTSVPAVATATAISTLTTETEVEVNSTATLAMEIALTEIEENKMVETEAPAEMSLLAQGEFYAIAHEGSGQASIYQLSDGSRILRFEEFYATNGPDLHVYLVPANPVPDTVGSEIAGYLDLGKLKGNIGDQNYEIPLKANLELYGSVVIWCEPFRVPFSAAPLGMP